MFPNGRCVRPELLDRLPPDDPVAVSSRRDLRRINARMGNARLIAKFLASVTPADQPVRLAELGAGDGSLMLAVARCRARSRGPVELALVDRLNLLSPETVAAFGECGWSVRAVRADVFDWLNARPGVDVLVANLFLHHFSDEDLQRLFEVAAQGCRALIACETRRVAYPRLAGQLLRLIGCNPVTLHDGIISIGAGFVGQELTHCWPPDRAWEVTEYKRGWFTHVFQAVRRAAGPNG